MPVLPEVMSALAFAVLTAVVNTGLAAPEVETGRRLLLACTLDVDSAVVVAPEVAPSATVVVIETPPVTAGDDDAG